MMMAKMMYDICGSSSCIYFKYFNGTCDTAEWVMQCQTYEGGFGGEPFNEAHGGYIFCGLHHYVFQSKQT